MENNFEKIKLLVDTLKRIKGIYDNVEDFAGVEAKKALSEFFSCEDDIKEELIESSHKILRDELKYVITDLGPIIFNKSISHSEVVGEERTVLSAGFLIWNKATSKIEKCYGGSDSLKVKSNEIDKKIINEFLLDRSFVSQYNLSSPSDFY